MDATSQEVIDLIIESVNLHHLDRSKIDATTSLMEGGLELDSIDVLEVVMAVENKYGLKIESGEDGKKHFRSIGTISDFVRSHGKS